MGIVLVVLILLCIHKGMAGQSGDRQRMIIVFVGDQYDSSRQNAVGTMRFWLLILSAS